MASADWIEFATIRLRMKFFVGFVGVVLAFFFNPLLIEILIEKGTRNMETTRK